MTSQLPLSFEYMYRMEIKPELIKSRCTCNDNTYMLTPPAFVEGRGIPQNLIDKESDLRGVYSQMELKRDYRMTH